MLGYEFRAGTGTELPHQGWRGSTRKEKEEPTDSRRDLVPHGPSNIGALLHRGHRYHRRWSRARQRTSKFIEYLFK